MKLIITTTLILGFLTNTFCQSAAGIISKSVGLISFENKTRPGTGKSGTATFIKRFTDTTYTKALIYLVTNKHVLPTFEENKEIQFRIQHGASPSKSISPRIQIYNDNGNLKDYVKLDPDSNDLAVIDFTGYFINNPQFNDIMDNMMPFTFLATDDSLATSGIDVGSEILFIGYPSNLYDKRNAAPIVRAGIVSSSPYEDFYFSDTYRLNVFNNFNIIVPEKLSGFLIDATTLHGSSGSLVISKPSIIKIGKDGQPRYYRNPLGELFVLGIVTYTYPDLDNRLNSTYFLANIGGVISSRQIIKTINLFAAPQN